MPIGSVNANNQIVYNHIDEIYKFTKNAISLYM